MTETKRKAVIFIYNSQATANAITYALFSVISLSCNNLQVCPRGPETNIAQRMLLHENLSENFLPEGIVRQIIRRKQTLINLMAKKNNFPEKYRANFDFILAGTTQKRPYCKKPGRSGQRPERQQTTYCAVARLLFFADNDVPGNQYIVSLSDHNNRQRSATLPALICHRSHESDNWTPPV